MTTMKWPNEYNRLFFRFHALLLPVGAAPMMLTSGSGSPFGTFLDFNFNNPHRSHAESWTVPNVDSSFVVEPVKCGSLGFWRTFSSRAGFSSARDSHFHYVSNPERSRSGVGTGHKRARGLCRTLLWWMLNGFNLREMFLVELALFFLVFRKIISVRLTKLYSRDRALLVCWPVRGRTQIAKKNQSLCRLNFGTVAVPWDGDGKESWFDIVSRLAYFVSNRFINLLNEMTKSNCSIGSGD